MELEKIKTRDEIAKGTFSSQCFVWELILAQDNVFRSLEGIEEKELLNITIQNMELKTKQTDIFGSISMLPTYLLYAKIALNDSTFYIFDSYQKQDVIEFVHKPLAINDNIIECVKRYIKLNK